MLRVTPAAGFAVQQTLHRYPQVDGVYLASAGYYPLSPWEGFGVLLGWTAVALGLAVILLRKRDA
jgi:ABC-type transport system involved in multi-copper enzyme maturation permease subunit